jgi:hypothetical protein
MRFVISSLVIGLLASGWISGHTPVAIAQPAKPAVSPVSTTAADNEAAAKHAKRTLCLKQAKAKKLIGEQKTAYIKNCVNAP